MIRSEIAELLDFFVSRETPRRASGPEDALEIYSATQQVDSAYERFRNLLDPGDEDILRRKAIARFINLRWDQQSSDSETQAINLLKDLARGRYIPSNTSRSHVEDIAKILKKAFSFWEAGGVAMPRWFLPIITVEIDRVIYPRDADDALVYFFFEETRKRVSWPDKNISDDEKETQLFLACHRVLAKTDEAELFWHLYKTAEPGWLESELTKDELKDIASRFAEAQSRIEAALRSRIAVKVLKRLQAPVVPFRVLREIMRNRDAEKILNDDALLAASVRETLTKKILKIEQQMLKRVWHAAAFLFLTKGVLAIATEIPYELVMGGIRFVPLLVNLFFPPVLLMLMAGSVGRPGKENTARVIEAVSGIVKNEARNSQIIVTSSEVNTFQKSIFGFMYFMTALISLSAVIWLLNILRFSLIGGFYFVVFLGLVSFLGLRLRHSMREFRIIVPKQSIFSIFFDFFTVPILDFGRELSLRASQINVFLFLLDAFIEAPFKLLLGLLEEWFSFMREKKEDLV